MWTQNGTLIRGINPNGTGITPQSNMLEGIVNQSIIFPGQTTQAQALTLASSAQYSDGETLVNVKFYLDGDVDSLAILQGTWPTQGGGMQISFDQGLTYTTFSQGPSGVGDVKYPATWLLLPAVAIGLGATDGILTSVDTAQLLVRFVVPSQATQYQIYLPTLEVDFDII